mgnify:CR=1 FL=1
MLIMERMTIYIDDQIKHCLLELSAERSKKKGKRVGMAEMIREALIEYLKRRGIKIGDKESVVNKMLSTRGTLDEDFEKRVKEVQEEFQKWKI